MCKINKNRKREVRIDAGRNRKILERQTDTEKGTQTD